MAHIVTSKCQGCKFTDCVEVCPVACFYELENQLVIHPEECIDCTACVSECPVEAIYAEADVPAQYQADIEFNSAQSKRLREAGHDAIVETRSLWQLPRRRKQHSVTDHRRWSTAAPSTDCTMWSVADHR